MWIWIHVSLNNIFGTIRLHCEFTFVHSNPSLTIACNKQNFVKVNTSKVYRKRLAFLWFDQISRKRKY